MDNLTWFDLVAWWLILCALTYAVAWVGIVITDWLSRRMGWL